MIRPIQVYPDKFLTAKDIGIDLHSRKIIDIVNDLIETMKAANGIGLSANQIGVLQRIFVLQMPGEEAKAYINPQYKPTANAKLVEGQEGCLSFPGVYILVPRYDEIEATWLQPVTNTLVPQSKVLTGLEARAFQHECEHLDGEAFLRHNHNSQENARIARRMEKFKLKGIIYPTGAGKPFGW